MMKFDEVGKLSNRFVGPYGITQRIDWVTHSGLWSWLPLELSKVSNVIKHDNVKLVNDLSYKE